MLNGDETKCKRLQKKVELVPLRTYISNGQYIDILSVPSEWDSLGCSQPGCAGSLKRPADSAELPGKRQKLDVTREEVATNFSSRICELPEPPDESILPKARNMNTNAQFEASEHLGSIGREISHCCGVAPDSNSIATDNHVGMLQFERPTSHYVEQPNGLVNNIASLTDNNRPKRDANDNGYHPHGPVNDPSETRADQRLNDASTSIARPETQISIASSNPGQTVSLNRADSGGISQCSNAEGTGMSPRIANGQAIEAVEICHANAGLQHPLRNADIRTQEFGQHQDEAQIPREHIDLASDCLPHLSSQDPYLAYASGHNIVPLDGQWEIDFRNSGTFDNLVDIDFRNSGTFDNLVDIDFRNNGTFDNLVDIDFRNSGTFDNLVDIDFRNSGTFDNLVDIDFRNNGTFDNLVDIDFRNNRLFDRMLGRVAHPYSFEQTQVQESMFQSTC